MHDTVGDLGIERDCTLRCSGRVRGGAQRFRQPDIPGQWSVLCVPSRAGCGRCVIVASGVEHRKVAIQLHLCLRIMLGPLVVKPRGPTL